MARRILFAAAALVVVAAVAVALVMGGGGSTPEPRPERPAVARECPDAERTGELEVSGTVEIGAPLPAFRGETVDGCVVAQADYAGAPLVVVFGASWCIPCEEEWPALVDALDTSPGEFSVVAVAFQDLPSDTRRFLDETGAPWQAVEDPDGALARAFRVTQIPTTFFVDRAGVVVSRLFGGGGDATDELRAALADLLEG